MNRNAKQKGWLRLEGKEYVVQDGDVVEIRHGFRYDSTVYYPTLTGINSYAIFWIARRRTGAIAPSFLEVNSVAEGGER